MTTMFLLYSYRVIMMANSILLCLVRLTANIHCNYYPYNQTLDMIQIQDTDRLFRSSNTGE